MTIGKKSSPESQIKALVKQYVKECVNEMFAELQIEKLVENAIRKSAPVLAEKAPVIAKSNNIVSGRSVGEIFEDSEPTYSSPTTRRVMNDSNLRRKMQVSDDEWKSVYADIKSPILSEERTAAGVPVQDNPERPELVPEVVMERAGFMKDYSAFLKPTKKFEARSAEEEETFIQRKRMLAEKIKAE